MTAIRIPQEFYDFCLYLHQDSIVVYGATVEDIIAGALRHMDQEHRRLLRKFIDDLLTGGYSDAELLAIYRTTDAELVIHGDKGMREFFAMVRNMIDQDILK